MANKIVFGLGSNLGDRALHLKNAEKLLIKNLELQELKISQIFKNKALLKENAPKEWNIDFFNIAISAKINLEKFSPVEILEIIKKIEQEIGRSNQDKLWAPREIDIDILAIDDLIINLEGKLQIPHKSLLERDFFIKTFAEIEPNWKYPVAGDFFGKKIKDFL
jgi:2-amino-4-hydroxy-6-hydroxymethyldihydropteridine diphosphokinase/dihydropteroate synthase